MPRSPSNGGTSGFMYPDPSHYGLNAPREQFQTRNSTLTLGSYPPAAPVPAIITTPAPPFALDPALLAQGSATVSITAFVPVSTSALITGPCLALRLAGLQPFPVLSPGLQAPIGLTKVADIFVEQTSVCRGSYPSSAMSSQVDTQVNWTRNEIRSLRLPTIINQLQNCFAATVKLRDTDLHDSIHTVLQNQVRRSRIWRSLHAWNDTVPQKQARRSRPSLPQRLQPLCRSCKAMLINTKVLVILLTPFQI